MAEGVTASGPELWGGRNSWDPGRVGGHQRGKEQQEVLLAILSSREELRWRDP